MKTLSTNTPPSLKPYALAAAGEHTAEWATDQLAKFRPGGANYRRLRDMQTVGVEIEKHPALYAAAPDLLAALERLTKKTEKANAFQHSGGGINAEDWSELYQLANESWATIARAKGETQTLCRHCGRRIVYDEKHGWVDPEATGDDSVWREGCEKHDTFTMEHEPEVSK